MDCLRVRELIVFYVDGELGPDTIAQVAAHLDACLPCARASEREKAFVDSVRRRLSPPAAPPRLLEKIRDAIALEPARSERGRTSRLMLGWAAAACLVLLAGAFAIESFVSPEGVLHALALPAQPVTTPSARPNYPPPLQSDPDRCRRWRPGAE